jgi:hypothetical protein
MAACPNCGRQTLRTKDWACQWCGYPLISRAFKAIDKTFKELQEERLQAATQVAPDMDAEEAETPEFVEEIEEAEPAPEPQDKRKHKPEKKKEKPEKQKFSIFRSSPPKRPQPQPEPPPSVSYPEHRPEPPPVPKPVVPVYTPEPRRQEPRPEPPSKPAPRAEIAPPPVSRPEPVVVKPVAPPPPPPAAVVPPPPPPAPEPPRAKPEIIVEAPPPYISSVKMEDIKEGLEISTDDLDALFKADKSGTNNRMTGKTIVLKGVVEKVFIREHLDIRYIMLTGKRKLSWSDRCTFNPDDAAKANRLNEGDEVMVRAKYDGYGKNIIFKDCQII